MSDDSERGSTDDSGRIGGVSRRRFLAASSVSVAALSAGCTGGGDGGSGDSSNDASGGGGSSDDGGSTAGSAGDDVEDIVIYLTPGTPSDVRGRYEPLIRMIDGEIDTINAEAKVLGSYSAIRPALQQADLDIGEAPQGQPNDFEGVWSNHDVALEKLGNGEADAATTWGGNGLPHIPEEYKSEFPQRVLDKSSFIETLDTEEPKFRPFWFSFPIPKQPVYARKNWDSPNKEKIGELLRNSDEELVKQYYPEDYNENELPFSTLQDTSIDDYQPIIERINAVGLELGEL
jgi:ABC-type phosphate/phosphonate transport system substrate-binding protein